MALNYGSATSFAISNGTDTGIANLASSTTAYAQSAVVSTSTTNNVVDAMVRVKVKVGNITTPSASTNLYIYAYGLIDDSTYPGGSSTNEVITGAAADITMSATSNNVRYLGSINCHTANITYITNPMSIAGAFGGVMPKKWGILIQNQTGVATSSTEADHSAHYTEIYYN